MGKRRKRKPQRTPEEIRFVVEGKRLQVERNKRHHTSYDGNGYGRAEKRLGQQARDDT